MIISAPAQNEDFGFYNSYIRKVKSNDLIAAFLQGLQDFKDLILSLSEEQLLHRYEAGKWNIKEVAAHLVDAERNFCYRIMRISRGDQAPLPMYNISEFTLNSHATKRDIKNILAELELLRNATILMFEGMHPSMLDKTGPARDVQMSVRALGYAMVGHVMHHMEIIKERYLAQSVS